MSEISVDLDSNTLLVSWRNAPLRLTATTAALAHVLVKHAPKSVPIGSLETALNVGPDAVRQTMRRLRKLISRVGLEIRNGRGAYKLQRTGGAI